MVRRIGSNALPALLLVLALLLLLQVRQKQVEKKSGGKSSSSKTTDHWGGPDGDLGGIGPAKPSKVRQRPEQPEKPKSLVAKPVKGRPGYVYHPVDGRILDVRGVWAGTMVRNSGVTFLVPKMGYIVTPEAAMKSLTPLEGGTEVVMCRPFYPEARWDDGTPVIPGDAAGGQEGS